MHIGALLRNMDALNIFIIKNILLLWILCTVLGEHHKRDVHRIVIKQRIPRGPKKSHGHSSHDHKYGRHYSGRNHGHKKGKKDLISYEKDSFEDEGSYSKENSFEDIFQNLKGHKSHYQNSKKPHSLPPYFQDYGELKQIPYKDDSKFIFQNEWTPLSSEQIQYGSRETYRDRHKKKRDSRRNYLTSLKPPPIDLTTSYPFQFETSSIYPQLIGYPSAFSNFNLNQKIIESNQSPLIGTIEDPNVAFSELQENYNRLKNHRASYEVTELTPAASNTNTIISVPDDIESEETVEVSTKISKHKKEEVKSTQRPIRSRGRTNYRGQSKVKQT